MRMRIIGLAALSSILSGPPLYAQSAAPAAATEPPAASAPAPIDPAAHGPVVESWFKVLFQTRHIGHARILYGRIVEKGVPAIRYVIESNHVHPETGLPASSRIEAVLQASDTSLLRYNYVADVTQPPFGRVELMVTCERKDQTRWSAVHQGPSGRFPAEDISSETPLTVEDAFPFLVAGRENLMKNGGTLPVRVFNPLHLDKLVLDLDLEVLPPEKRPIAGQDVTVSPCRWKRPGLLPESVVTSTVYVGEGGVMQESSQIQSGATVPIVLIRTATEKESLPEGRKLVKRRGRRDPFDIDKVLTPKEDPAAAKKPVLRKPEAAPTRTPAEEMAKLLAEAARLVTAAEGQHREYGKIAEPKIKKYYEDFLDIVLKLQRNEALSPEQRAELDTLRGRIERVYPGALAIIDQGKKLVGEAREALEAMSRVPAGQQNYAMVEKMLGEIKGLETSRELSGAPQHLTAFKEQVLKPVAELEKRMSARQQFQKIRIEITGIIYHLVESPWPVAAGARVLGRDLRVIGTVPLFTSRSGAIVNGVPVLEGDVLDGKGVPAPDLKPEDGVLVVKIRTDEVVFRYKNEEIPVPIKEPLKDSAPGPGPARQ